MVSPRTKRPPPFSLRLTLEERFILEKRASGMPLGAFIRSSLFDCDAVPGMASIHPEIVDKRRLLPQILAKLGPSDDVKNLNEFARLAGNGALPLTPEIEAEIHKATTDITDMKTMLMKALRIKEH